MIRTFLKFMVVLLIIATSENVVAQCGMGIPGAGNPGCIPPDILNQQNNNHEHNGQPQSKTIIVRHKWADRWGAMVADNINPVIGFSTGAKSKRDALRLAKSDCLSKGGRGCDNLFAYRNQCAVMIAVKGGGAYYQSAPYVETAEGAGMKRCAENKEICQVIYSNCSLPEAVPIR